MIEELFTMGAINVVQGRFFSSLCTAAPVLKKTDFFEDRDGCTQDNFSADYHSFFFAKRPSDRRGAISRGYIRRSQTTQELEGA